MRAISSSRSYLFLYLCLANLFAGCDANADEESLQAILNIGQYTEEFAADFLNGTPPEIGQMSFSVDKAINLSRFPSVSIRTVDDSGWQQNISLIPEEYESTLFFYQVVEGRKSAGSIWDVQPGNSFDKNKVETPGDSLTITFYGFFIERPGITYPANVIVDIVVDLRETAHIEIIPAKHSISLDDITVKMGSDFGPLPEEPGLVFDFGADVLDTDLRPVLISRRLEQGVSGRAFSYVGAYWGDSNEFSGHEYGRVATLATGIREDSEFLFFVLRKDE